MAKKPRDVTTWPELVDLIGERVALKLMANFGGRDIQPPKMPPEHPPILLGPGVGDGGPGSELVGGGWVYVPHGRPPRSVRAEVMALTRQGLDRVEIARRTGVTVRHVRRMRNGRPAAAAPASDSGPAPRPAQQDLFDPD